MTCNCNDCQDEYVEDAFPDYSPPTWRDAEPANEVQAKAWMEIINDLFQEYKNTAINLPAAIALICNRVKVRPENYASLSLQIERFIRESPEVELRKGKNGGMFRKEPDTRGMKPIDALDYVDRLKVQPIAVITLKKMVGVPDMITGKLENDYTCGCGNTQCNKTEKSCWKCGAAIKP